MTTHEQQAAALFEEWKKTQKWWYTERLHILDQKDCENFAAFCLEKTGKEIPVLIGKAREEACKVREHTAIDWVFRIYVDEEYSEEAVSKAVEEFREFRK